ncbi:CRISPR-associated endoribonuclease Cas6 [Pelobium manganitolerans]|uniref:CRISPR-associated endoribonuclease Cas6 n=1 Tax=Pelobium manganitolerans TaxID=1842495 RepID=UPI003FA359CB
MKFRITLNLEGKGDIIPINYQYPLSSALYRIIAKGDAGYADFLHEKGYGKGFKFFTFSQINVPFKIVGDRMKLLERNVVFDVAFHLPVAMESFVKGLFNSESITIADRKSKAVFKVASVESRASELQQHSEHEIVQVRLSLTSPVVAGVINGKGNYDFLSPDDERFTESLIYNWRNKIATCFDEETALKALLLMSIVPLRHPYKSRLITIKADTSEETKIKGWMNFELNVTGEKRFVELLMNGGCGIYNSVVGGGHLEYNDKGGEKPALQNN